MTFLGRRDGNLIVRARPDALECGLQMIFLRNSLSLVYGNGNGNGKLLISVSDVGLVFW